MTRTENEDVVTMDSSTIDDHLEEIELGEEQDNPAFVTQTNQESQKSSQTDLKQYMLSLIGLSKEETITTTTTLSPARKNPNDSPVFSTPSYYSPVFVLLCLIPYIAIILISIVPWLSTISNEEQDNKEIMMMNINDKNDSNDDDDSTKSTTREIFLFRTIFPLILITFIYSIFFWTRTISIYPDTRIKVQTFIWSFTFSNATQVTALGRGLTIDDFCTLRMKFITGMLQNRILLHFEKGWDVVVSPQDVNGFLQAMELVIEARATTKQRQTIKQRF